MTEKKTSPRVCEIDDSLTGKRHEWSYNRGLYTCLKCGTQVLKDQFKALTDTESGNR